MLIDDVDNIRQSILAGKWDIKAYSVLEYNTLLKHIDLSNHQTDLLKLKMLGVIPTFADFDIKSIKQKQEQEAKEKLKGYVEVLKKIPLGAEFYFYNQIFYYLGVDKKGRIGLIDTNGELTYATYEGFIAFSERQNQVNKTAKAQEFYDIESLLKILGIKL